MRLWMFTLGLSAAIGIGLGIAFAVVPRPPPPMRFNDTEARRVYPTDLAPYERIERYKK
jgi:hypothetical protein